MLVLFQIRVSFVFSVSSHSWHEAVIYSSGNYTQVDVGLMDSAYSDNVHFVNGMQSAGQGRELQTIKLQKPPVGGLGFSVVGLKSENRGELGIFVQDLQSEGIAEM